MLIANSFGALVDGSATIFRVWSPQSRRLEVELETGEIHPMDRLENGVFEARVEGAGAGTRYRIRVDEERSFPDPGSRYQPEGVHGPSMVVDPSAYAWRDDEWRGISQRDLVLYELHVGTFSPEGTFDGVRRRLPYLKSLGITAVELMPVDDFPGRWNWGYDHAALYAPSRAYGRPDDLRRLVDEAHGLGISVFLDVVYNHLGPDGAYLAAFAPMFTDRHSTPWGMAINLDDEESEGVRNLFIDNALHWLMEYHIDGLRLDATHAIIDDSPVHFLAQLSAAVEKLEPERLLIAEDSRNLNTLVLPRSEGGFGLDAVWSDDFHHQVRHVTAGDSEGYFAHFVGMDARDLAETVSNGWYYGGKPSRLSGTLRGTDSSRIRPDQFVICIQNHDQVGNRPLGTRLHHDISPELYRAATALLLFAPETPLLFMGQEWAAGSPFLFFTDHGADLGRQVTEGRKREFVDFSGFEGEVPDPQLPETFERSRLRWEEHEVVDHARVLNLYRDLLELRRRLSGAVRTQAHGSYALRVRREANELIVSFREGLEVPYEGPVDLLLDTEHDLYAGNGRPAVLEDHAVVFSSPGAVILLHRS